MLKHIFFIILSLAYKSPNKKDECFFYDGGGQDQI